MSAAFRRGLLLGGRLGSRRAASTQAGSIRDGRLLRMAVGCTMAGGAALLVGNEMQKRVIGEVHAKVSGTHLRQRQRVLMA
jgi:hypothetical protein